MNGKTSPTAATPASEFKLTRTGIFVTLPSTGRVVKQRAIPLVRALARGDIPDELTPLASALIWGAREADPKKKITIKDLALEYADLMDWVVKESLLEPRITPTGEEDDAIQITDLDPREVQEIYQNATEPARMLYPFRYEQDRGVELGEVGGGNVLQT